MKVYHGVAEFEAPEFPIITTGTFDGVHTGHLDILNRLTHLAKQHNGESVVVSFYPHPRKVLNPDADIKLITTLDEKITQLERAGIDHFVIIEFTKEFSRLSSLNFVRDVLVKQLNAKMLVIGYDHQFGRNREGSIQDLQEYATTYDFSIEQIQAKTFEDINISSTKIRKALAAGNMQTALQYLGYHYSLTGKVAHGQKIGQSIGYPTANVEVVDTQKVIPGNGVYAVNVSVKGNTYGGMLNIGTNPTVSNAEKQKIEVHIFDFNQDLYGQEITVTFIDRIRSEQKFEGIEELKNQLTADMETAQKMLA